LSIDGGTQAAVIGAGATVLLVLGGAIFRCADLRGDTNRKWSSRKDVAVVALDEKTVFALRELRDEISSALPAEGIPFDPAEAIVDPSVLIGRVEVTAKFYRSRVRMEKDLKLVLRMCRVFYFSLLALAVGVLVITLFYAELWHWDVLHWGGFGLGGAAIAALLISGGIYSHRIDRLGTSELMADTASQAGAAGDGQ
jgi:hypothetical protein